MIFFRFYTTSSNESQLEKEVAYLTEINEFLREKPAEQQQEPATTGPWRKR